MLLNDKNKTNKELPVYIFEIWKQLICRLAFKSGVLRLGHLFF